MEMVSACQEKFLSTLIATQTIVSVYLKNGIKLTGTIIAASNSAIFLNEPVIQLVYKHQISTICVSVAE